MLAVCLATIKFNGSTVHYHWKHYKVLKSIRGRQWGRAGGREGTRAKPGKRLVRYNNCHIKPIMIRYEHNTRLISDSHFSFKDDYNYSSRWRRQSPLVISRGCVCACARARARSCVGVRACVRVGGCVCACVGEGLHINCILDRHLISW